MIPMDGKASSHHSSSNSLDKNSTRDKRDVNNTDTRTKSQPERGKKGLRSHQLQVKIQRAGSQDKLRINSSDHLERIHKLGHHSRDLIQEIRIRNKNLVKIHRLGPLRLLSRLWIRGQNMAKIHKLGHHNSLNRELRSNVHMERIHRLGLLNSLNKELSSSSL